jgi:hypothetical protein
MWSRSILAGKSDMSETNDNVVYRLGCCMGILGYLGHCSKHSKQGYVLPDEIINDIWHIDRMFLLYKFRNIYQRYVEMYLEYAA